MKCAFGRIPSSISSITISSVVWRAVYLTLPEFADFPYLQRLGRIRIA